MSDASSNASKRMLSIGLAAIIVLSSIVVVLPVQKAYAAVSIATSVDNLGNRFFGPSLVRVLITDTAKTNDADSINVDVEVRRGTTSLGQTSVAVDAIGTSGQFELYIAAHTDAKPKNPTQSNADDDTAIAGENSIVRIYPEATSPEDITNLRGIDVPSDLRSGDRIIITYGGQSKEIRFERSTASLTTDRTTAGDENRIILRLNDQDANIDPTAVDEFPANDNNLISPSSPTPLDFDDAKWKETGQNTGIFELVVGVNTSVDGGAELTTTFPSSATFTVRDHDVYDVYTNAQSPYDIIKSTTSTSSQSVSLRNVNGSIDLAAPLTIGNGFQIRITDADRNKDTTARDIFSTQVKIINSTLPESLVFRETGDNTGVFVPDLAGDKIEIVPVATTDDLPSDEEVIVIVTDKIVLDTDNKIYVLASAIAEDIDLTITYRDLAPDPAPPAKDFIIVRKIQHFAGNISTTTPSVPVTGKAIIEINDMDLNTNPNGKDFYTITIDGTTAPYFSGLAELNVKVRGTAFTSSSVRVSLEETENNSGIFRGEVDISSINSALGANPLADGDRVTFEYIDNTERPTITRTVDVRIGKPSGVIELDRTSYPPSRDLNGDGDLADDDDTPTKIRIVITDPSFNTSSTSQDTLPIQVGRDGIPTNIPTNFDNGSLKIELRKGNTTLTFLPNAALGFPTTASEDGVNTGRFTVDVNLPRNVNDANNNNVIDVGEINVANPEFVINDGWQIRAIYKDDNGDDQTATASIVQNTAVITTDKPTYDLGSTIILQVREPDWNNDSDKVDEIPTSIADLKVDSDKVTDDTLAQIAGLQGITLDPSKLRETGKNTGIFEIKIQNINANLVSRGKNLEFTYTDRTPSGGGLEQEVKLAVLIASTQPDIVFDREVYTPFDRMCIQIVDPGANSDSDAKDKLFVGANVNARVRIIVGGTTETWSNTAPNGSKNIGTWEETATNSGVFHITGATNCVLISDVAGIDNNDITNAKPGDGIRVEYRTADRQFELSKTARIAFNDGSITFDKDAYRIGETARITIEDPDENRNPDVPDQFTVKVVSEADPAGISVTVRETGDRTGKFTADIILTSGVSSGNRLQVREGDQITAIYTDETVPGAQTIKQSLVNRDALGLRTLQTRDVAATATIGVIIPPTERFAVQQPRTVDQAGNPTTPQVNVPVSIATQIKNNTARAMDYVYIVQVKDANGVVVSLSTVSSTLDAGRTANVSASWMPTAPGTYTIETFVWSELGKPSPLSPLQRITVTAT